VGQKHGAQGCQSDGAAGAGRARHCPYEKGMLQLRGANAQKSMGRSGLRAAVPTAQGFIKVWANMHWCRVGIIRTPASSGLTGGALCCLGGINWLRG